MIRCGFVAVVGPPNAGKSTLINSLVGQKVTIVSPKVQTTRSRILGIALEGTTQIIFMDTPGIFFSPKRKLEMAMVQSAWNSLSDADGIMVIIDVTSKTLEETDSLLERLKDYKKRIVIVLNKIDLLPKATLLPLAEKFSRPFIDHLFMISALTGDGVPDIKGYWAMHLPQGPWLFPEDQLTDLPLRLLAAEMTREEIFNRLHEELPYSIWVETEAMEEFKDGSMKINQCIYVQRESQRPIVLGKNGRQIKAIGEAARKQLRHVLKRPVHLFLHVKVKPEWINDPRLYKSIGLNF